MTTPKLSMPELSVGQAGKELTHNQALAILDQLAQAVVVDKDLATPPGSPANGAMYIVAAGATGAWAGQSGNLAFWLTSVGAWTFAVPVNGWSVWVTDEAARYERKAGAWVVFAGGGGTAQGINRLINGAFNVNQRTVTGTVVLAAGIYGHDRWKAGSSGCTYTFATAANVTTITITAGSLQQVIEGINLQSGTHVLSWSGTAQGKIGAGSYGASGITGTATGGTNLTVEFNVGTLSFVQLEPGSVASQFESRSISAEESLCYRYFEKGSIFILMYSLSGVNIGGTSKFITKKRAVPTIVQTPVSEFNVSTTTNNSATGTPTESFMSFRITTATGGCQFSETWTASAEL